MQHHLCILATINNEMAIFVLSSFTSSLDTQSRFFFPLKRY